MICPNCQGSEWVCTNCGKRDSDCRCEANRSKLARCPVCVAQGDAPSTSEPKGTPMNNAATEPIVKQLDPYESAWTNDAGGSQCP